MPAWPEDNFHLTPLGFCTEQYQHPDKLTYGIYMAVLLDIVPNVWASHGTSGVHLEDSTGGKPQCWI